MKAMQDADIMLRPSELRARGWTETLEFIPISNVLAFLIEPCRDRRHDPWLVYGLLTCSPALRSS